MAIASSGEMLRGVSLSSSPPDKSYYHSCHFWRLLCQLQSGHISITGAVLYQLQQANIVIVAIRAVALLGLVMGVACLLGVLAVGWVVELGDKHTPLAAPL